MKALIYFGPEQLEFGDAEHPTPVEGEVILRIDSVGICGSDMHAFLGHDNRRPAPLILGHEVAGVVADGPQAGLRVTVNPLVTCGICAACTTGRDNLCPDRQIISMPPREGGFAEFVAIPTSNLVQVPDGFSLEQASLTEPIACGWHAVRLAQSVLDKDLSGVNVLVIGGGAIGVGAVLSLRCLGVRNIIVLESNELRRKYLSQKTEIQTRDPKDLKSVTEFDLVIDAVGILQTRNVASQVVRPGGVIVHIGLGAAEGGLDFRRMTLQEITFIGTYTYTKADFRATAQAMFLGKLGSLDWYEKRPLSEGAQAFTDIRTGSVHSAKIILKP